MFMRQSNYMVEKALQVMYYLQSKTHVIDKMSLVKLLFLRTGFISVLSAFLCFAIPIRPCAKGRSAQRRMT